MVNAEHISAGNGQTHLRSVLFSCSSFLWWPECDDSCHDLKVKNENSLLLGEDNRGTDNALGKRRRWGEAIADLLESHPPLLAQVIEP